MKNLLRVFIIPCLVNSVSYGQITLVKFKAGPEIETARTNEIGYAGNVDQGIVCLADRRGKLILTGFNPSSLSQINEGEEVFSKERNFNTEFVANMAGKSYWLNSDWDKQNEKEKLYAAEIDTKNCKLKGQSLILEASKISGDQLAAGIWFSASKTINKYKFDYSSDRKFLLVSYRLIPDTHIDKNNFDKIGLQIFDEYMKKIWGKEFTMPYSTARMEYGDFIVDTHGDVYIISKVYNSDARKEKTDGLPGFHFELFKFNEGDNPMKSIPVSAENYTISSSNLVESEKHEIFIVSGGSKSPASEGIEGFYISKITASGNPVKYNTGFFELPLEELAKFDSKKAKRKKVYKNNGEFKIRSMIIQADGSFFVSGEDYARVYLSGSSGNAGCNWYYDNITAIKINSDGKAAWAREIPKQTQNYNQAFIGEYPGQLSYVPLADESGYYFVFNDQEDNLNLKEGEEPKRFGDADAGNLILVKIDQLGKISKQLLFTKEKGEKINPVEFTKLTATQLVGKCWNRSKNFIPMQIMLK